MLTNAPQLFTYIETVIGTLLLAGDGEALSLVGFPSGKMQHRHKAEWRREDARLLRSACNSKLTLAANLKRLICA